MACKPEPKQPALADVVAPLVKQVLHAAVNVGLIASQVNGGLVTAVSGKGEAFCVVDHSRTAVTESVMRLYVHSLKAKLVEFTENNILRVDITGSVAPGQSYLHYAAFLPCSNWSMGYKHLASSCAPAF